MRKITSGIIQRGCGCNIIKAQYRIGPYIYVLWEVSTNGRSIDNCSSVDISYYSLKQIALLCCFWDQYGVVKAIGKFLLRSINVTWAISASEGGRRNLLEKKES